MQTTLKMARERLGAASYGHFAGHLVMHEVLHEVHEGKLPLPSSLYSIIRDPDSWNDPVLCC